jgi:hypothetical protein
MMAKPVQLTPDALGAAQKPPQAATPARAPTSEPAAKEAPANVPLQVRVPKADAKAIRVTAAQLEISISEFVLMCVNDWQNRNPS